MSIVDGKGLIIWEGGYFEPGSDLLRRVQWAFARIRAEGGRIVLNEAGRPYGVPGDTAVGRANKSSTMTASGVSTVYYQWGRYLLYLDTGGRQGTPSAANPAGGPLASEHTQGIAIDCDAQDVYTATLRAKYFAQAGLKNTISSESWHWAIRGPFMGDTSTASSGATKLTDGGIPMGTIGFVTAAAQDAAGTKFSDVGYVYVGYSFEISSTGIYPLSPIEKELAIARGEKFFNWSPTDIYNHSIKVGLWEFKNPKNTTADPGFLTGYLLYGYSGNTIVKKLPGQAH